MFNIISLCANLKTLIIEGDQVTNIDKIMMSIFHPENLESLILNNVKLPSQKSLKKYSNLKSIQLSNIRFCNLKEFLEGFANIKTIEKIEISNSDMMKSMLSTLNQVSNLKYLKLENLESFILDDFNFLKQNNKILEIDINNNQVYIEEISQLLKIKCKKNIDLKITDKENNIIKDCYFKIYENKTEFEIPVEKCEEICQKVNLYKVDKIKLIINSYSSDFEYIKTLKKYKKELDIYIKNLSVLNLEQIEKMKTSLNLKKINIQNEDEWKEYDIDTCINIRKEINKLISNISKHVSVPEKILEIYRFLGKEFEVIGDDETNVDLKNKTCTKKQITNLLQNCLECMNIKSSIIFGRDEVNNQDHYWNQVEMNGTWYNLDLGLDSVNIKKKKSEYCLLSDESFLETHTPKAGKNNYCPEDFNPKLINVFFKTGLFKEKLLQSYFELTIEKIKKIFNKTQKQEILALPSGNDEKLKLNP